VRAKGSVVGVHVRKISIPRERKGEGERKREKGESDRDREPTHATCSFDRKDNSMKLLASVESTTILIDNQLCMREGGLAFAERILR